jgi:ubiquinone/menaquinone biosynthesis C-methylase UbiE
MTAVDIAWGMVRPAAEHERAEPRGIRYLRASGLALPFADGTFDFVTAFMSLMDMPHGDVALREMARVLAPAGFVQFSILHPCFTRGTPPEWVYDGDGRRRGLVVSDYFRPLDGVVDEWSFGAARRAGEQQRPFRIPYFTPTLSEWLNRVADAGLAIERVAEPRPDQTALARVQELYGYALVPWFLQVRARKPR